MAIVLNIEGTTPTDKLLEIEIMESAPEQEYEERQTQKENRLRSELKSLDEKRDVVLRMLGECLVERMDAE